MDEKATNSEAVLTIYSYLHSIDPSITGFEVLPFANDATDEWKIKLYYPDGSEGMLEGKGSQAYKIVDGGRFALTPFEEESERIKNSPDYGVECDIYDPRD